MIKRLHIVVAAILLLTAFRAEAQYISSGVDPASFKWNMIKTDKYKLIFPNTYSPMAQQVALLYDSIYIKAAYGLPLPSVRVPAVLHTGNLISNGMVAWAPKRIELYTNYPADQFASPWMRQLLVHEYRHAVQISSMRQGLSKAVTYVLGEQGLAICLAVLSKWFLEGDATMAETEMTTYGRGLQPSFTLGYRAYMEGGQNPFKQDKWVCGSFKDYVPDIYEYGYQMMTGSRVIYGNDFWDKVINYAARYPILINPTYFAYKKYGNTSHYKIYDTVFSRLRNFWDSIPPRDNTFRFIETHTDGWTRYKYPVALPDGEVMAIKSDFNHTPGFTRINPQTSSEKTLLRSSYVSSRPVLSEGRLYWTEFKPHAIWTQKNYSVVRMHDLKSGKTRFMTHGESSYFVTPIDKGRFAIVSLDSLGNSRIDIKNAEMRTVNRHKFGFNISISGLAWDDKTSTLAFIALTDDGMWLGKMNPENGSFDKITQPSYVTINNLTASDGRLYFNSIYSGLDEIHYLDLASGRQYRISGSRLGSYEPSAINSDSVLFASYTRHGYRIATQSTDTIEEIAHRHIPINLVNPPRSEWNVMNVDTLNLSVAATPAGQKKEKRYRKLPHLFNFHSWAPISFDPIETFNELEPSIHLGVTLLSQNALSNTEGFVSYGYDMTRKANFVKGKFMYYGLGPRISVASTYMWGQRQIYIPKGERLPGMDIPDDGDYFTLEGTIDLPLNLSSGGNSRMLNPAFSVTHYNSLVYRPDTKSFKKSFQTYEASLYYSNNLTMSKKDINPRWGYAAKVGLEGAFQPSFSDMYYAYARAYIPGLLQHHSLRLQGVYQYQRPEPIGFMGKQIYPRGSDRFYSQKNYYAGSVDYTMPLWYPDGGWNSWIYFQRIRMNLFYDYSFASSVGFGSKNYRVHSYGFDIGIDCNPLRATSLFMLDLTLAFPSDKKSPFFGASLSIPF